MSRYKPYPKYKESGVEWLGKVPEHWKTLPARSIVNNLVDKNEHAQDQRYLSLMANVGVIRYEDKGDVGNKKPDDLSKCKIVRKGNLVINSMNYSIGSFGMSGYDGVCSPVYVVLGIKEDVVFPRFALRLFENMSFQRYVASFGNGILAHRAAIGWDEIKGAYLPLPPISEQTAIANFLDRETAKIDTLIEKQQRLIELLKEKRQALISHAVTKGLDPNVKMKDSGVEWLGEEPDHWGKVRLRWVSRIFAGGTPDKSQLHYWNNGTIPWINSGAVNQLYITKPSAFITKEAYNNSSAKWIPVNALVMALAGQGKTKGMVAQLGIKTTCNQSMAAIVPSENIESRYLLWWLTSNYQRIRNMAGGDLRDGLNLELIGDIPCPYMPENEQTAIADFLDRETVKIDSLVEKAKQAISLLEERRTALISAAVTGKIDVREEGENHE